MNVFAEKSHSTIKPVGLSNIFISANELEVAERTENYYFYIVYDVADKTPKIWKIESSKLLDDENIKKTSSLFNTIEYKRKGITKQINLTHFSFAMLTTNVQVICPVLADSGRSQRRK